MIDLDLYSKRQDRKLANFITGYYFVQTLNLLVKLTIGNFASWTYLSRGFLIILLLIALKPMLERKFKAFLVTVTLFVLLFAYTFAFNYASFSEYSSIVMNVLTVFIPMAIAIASIIDKNILLQCLYIMSWPAQIILVIILLSMKGYGYSMVCGYTLTFQMFIVFDHYCENKKWHDLVACIIDLLFIIIYGSRGPVLCIAIMLLLKTVFSPNQNRNRKIVSISLIIVLGGLIYVFYNRIINVLLIIAGNLGFSSRNLYLLLNSTISSYSGRNSIISYYWRMIGSGPVLGHGLAGGWTAPGMYPHNIFVELLLAFGPVLGVVVCVVVVVVSFAGTMAKRRENRRLTHIFFAYSMCLLLSDSFLMCPMFFMLFAIGCQSFSCKIVIGRAIHITSKYEDLSGVK